VDFPRAFAPRAGVNPFGCAPIRVEGIRVRKK
jgi:hypothetical protein